MESQSVFAALRDALAALYLEAQDAQLLAADAGLDLTLIPFNTRPDQLTPNPHRGASTKKTSGTALNHQVPLFR